VAQDASCITQLSWKESPMKTILTVLAASALFASGAALACDDVGHHHADAQASKAPETNVVVADKADAPQAAKKPVAKQKAPAKSVAQATTPARTATN
jgi:hypothetical protein